MSYDNKIHTFYCDQTDQHEILKMWIDPYLNENFDIIIEDGLHTFNANVCFFENSIHKLNKNGYFIIEDILLSETHLFINKIKEEWNTKYVGLSFYLFSIPSEVNKCDNILLVVKKN
jgi:hypothetical protein